MPSTNIRGTSKIVFPLSIILFLALLLYLLLPLLSQTNSLLLFPLDDAYLRFSISKSIASKGVWGLSPHEFASASSSIIYPIILAVFFKMFGVNVFVSLLLNVAAAITFIWLLYRWLIKIGLSLVQQLVSIALTIYLTPLHILALYGMEHLFQILVAFLYIKDFCAYLSEDSNADKGSGFPKLLLLYAALSTSLRYEGLFLVLVSAVILLYRRRWPQAISLLGMGLLPLAIFGCYTLVHSGYVIPNSIIVKALPLPLGWEAIGTFFKDRIIEKLFYFYPTKGSVAGSRLLIVIALLGILYRFSDGLPRIYRTMAIFLLTIAILHQVFAEDAVNFRYEAYLIAFAATLSTGVFLSTAFVGLWRQNLAWKFIAVWVAFFLFFPLFARSWGAQEEIQYGYAHEYQYDYQAALFLQKYYNDDTIVMDEIGLASFMTTGRKLDMMNGIAYKEVTQAKLDGFTRLEYYNYLISKERPTIALIAAANYHPSFLVHWKKVATWHTRFRLPLGQSDLDFFAIDTMKAGELLVQLKEFQTQLPNGVNVEYP